MSHVLSSHGGEANGCGRIAELLGQVGWAVCSDFVPPELAARLAAECRVRWQEGAFRRARVGRGPDSRERPDIRSDHVLWLEEGALSEAQQAYFDALERLRTAINQTLFLGLFAFEGHLALYPPGHYYRRHLDRFHGTHDRLVSVILYLNPHWQADDGGALRLYLAPAGDTPHVDVPPAAGTLVAFLSERFWHEVLPARRQRLSLTGWFRRRG